MGLKARTINLQGTYAQQQLFLPPADKPYYCLSHDQLNFLDQVMVIENGGQHGQGYIFASKRVNPDDWFFACHFYQDPVMPGSFGIEAVIQAMQAYALQCGLGDQFASPHFEPVPNQHSSWKYRGQIVPTSLHWSLEVHITRIERTPDQVVIVGDASLWREQVRIHEIKQLGMRIVETPA
jgi:3-hydroxymyristoyl/3-hydroxydecanoyl-(acyl carrier protein) dehydratase